MCNPNLFGAILAKMTRDQGFEQVALVQLGATISSTSPPIRIAEEYAVLDCISGGRLVAGLPTGLGNDVSISYGITPMEHRERWREGIDLMLKAWTAKEFFAWNGKYFHRRVESVAARPSPWIHICKDANPYRASFLQIVGVAGTDRRAEGIRKTCRILLSRLCTCRPVTSLRPAMPITKSLEHFDVGKELLQYGDSIELKPLKAKDMIEKEFVVIGSPATVREKLEAMAKLPALAI
jgi:alkanesulfonate monooxygenase SsuD/methylene tetrahydromethanopterin reductase-like flavin-dependent oxidoreductase (luciferase family)